MVHKTTAKHPLRYPDAETARMAVATPAGYSRLLCLCTAAAALTVGVPKLLVRGISSRCLCSPTADPISRISLLSGGISKSPAPVCPRWTTSAETFRHHSDANLHHRSCGAENTVRRYVTSSRPRGAAGSCHCCCTQCTPVLRARYQSNGRYRLIISVVPFTKLANLI